jgi:hypothetical protein
VGNLSIKNKGVFVSFLAESYLFTTTPYQINASYYFELSLTEKPEGE